MHILPLIPLRMKIRMTPSQIDSEECSRPDGQRQNFTTKKAEKLGVGLHRQVPGLTKDELFELGIEGGLQVDDGAPEGRILNRLLHPAVQPRYALSTYLVARAPLARPGLPAARV